MNKEQFAALNDFLAEDYVTASKFLDGTLLLGFDEGYTTVHIYKKGDAIHVLKHKLDHLVSHRAAQWFEPESLVPSGASYTDRTRFEFAELLSKTFDIELKFKGEPSDEYEDGGFHGETIESDRFYKLSPCTKTPVFKVLRESWFIDFLKYEGLTENARETTDNKYSFKDSHTVTWGTVQEKISLVEKLQAFDQKSLLAHVAKGISLVGQALYEQRKVDPSTREPKFEQVYFNELIDSANAKFESALNHPLAKSDPSLGLAIRFAKNAFFGVIAESEFASLVTYETKTDANKGDENVLFQMITKTDAEEMLKMEHGLYKLWARKP
ncbi:hypothetical protein [Vibrio crassostreae]|uniref:hypothetical protein n=1 Tax=Vibrio crassostreae TaxID=246167 RepID=UPI001B317554|nr:hypothetical protein [Vibrio crassostreae]